MNEEKIFNFLGIEINKSEETNKLFEKVKILANKAYEEIEGVLYNEDGSKFEQKKWDKKASKKWK